MNVQMAAEDILQLKNTLINIREVLCSNSVQKGLEMAEEWDIPQECRVRCRKGLPGETAADAWAHNERGKKE